MSKKLYEESNIQAIADAIRNKNGLSATYTVAQMSTAITNITVLDTSDANATEEDIADGKTAYVNGVKITGNNVGSSGNTKMFSAEKGISKHIINHNGSSVLFAPNFTCNFYSVGEAG